MAIREIIFRGKRVDNGEWVYGYYVKGATRHCILKSLAQPHIYDVIPETVGEYTGLTDKNGIKMFVGDIVKITSHGYIPDTQNGEIVLYNGSYCIKYKWGLSKDFIKIIYHRIGKEDTWQDMGASGTITYSYEVIGNIIDNKELLGE